MCRNIISSQQQPSSTEPRDSASNFTTSSASSVVPNVVGATLNCSYSRKRKACHTQLSSLQNNISAPAPSETKNKMMMTKDSQSNNNSLHRMIQEEQVSRSTPDFSALMTTTTTQGDGDANTPSAVLFPVINLLWRERVAKWCYDVLDYLDESRDVAYVAMNLLDRYLAVLGQENGVQLDVLQPFEFEVMAFTALFLSIRVCGENKELEIPELLQLSSSGATSRHIMEAGHHMLEKLSWTHRILTPHAFLEEYVRLLVTASAQQTNSSNALISKDQAASLLEFATYLMEVSVCDSYFNAVPASQVALGSLVVAMTCDESLAASHQGFLASFFRTLQELTSIRIESAHMKDIISRLLDVYNQSHEAASESSCSPSSASNKKNNNDNSEAASHAHIQGRISSASNGSFVTTNTLPHIIVDDEEDTVMMTNEDFPIVAALARSASAKENLYTISPSSSLELLRASSTVIGMSDE